MTRNRNVSRTVAAVLAGVLLAVAGSGCGSGTEKKIVLEVTGPASADVTYGLGVDQTQDNGAKLPWKKEVTSTDDPLIVVITAQSKGKGDIHCKITVDGKEVKSNKSSGEFAIVTCSNG